MRQNLAVVGRVLEAQLSRRAHSRAIVALPVEVAVVLAAPQPLERPLLPGGLAFAPKPQTRREKS